MLSLDNTYSQEELRAFVDRECWSERSGSYVRFAGADELDASLLLAAAMGYDDAREQRLASTIDACRQCHNPKVGARVDCAECHRYHDRAKEMFRGQKTIEELTSTPGVPWPSN